MLADKLLEAMDYGRESGLDQFDLDLGSWWTCYPGRSDYFTHWGGAFKYAASVLGLPIGAYPHSRPPQAELPAEAKTQIETAYRRLGLIGSANSPKGLCPSTRARSTEGVTGPCTCMLITAVRPLACLVDLGLGPSLLGLGLFLRGVALRFGLVLLGLALVDPVVATGHRADYFLGLAHDVFHDALDPSSSRC